MKHSIPILINTISILLYRKFRALNAYLDRGRNREAKREKRERIKTEVMLLTQHYTSMNKRRNQN